MSSERRAVPEDALIEDLLRRAADSERGAAHGEAEECLRQILALRPEHAGARERLANVLAIQAYACQEREEYDAAIEGYEESLALDHRQARVCNNLGNVFKIVGRVNDAADAYRAAIAADPGLAEAHLNLGTLHYQLTGETAPAIAHLRTALREKPVFADASLNLGFLLDQDGDSPGAMQCYRDAIAASPEFAEAHFNHGMHLLLRGDFEKGWQEYDWRLRRPDLAHLWPHAGRARWDGTPLHGRKILLYGEQGFGDVIQFVRFATVAAERGGEVTVTCQSKLKELLKSVPGVSAVLEFSEPPPAFDVCGALMSLPRILGTTLETLPAPVPYLHPDAGRARHWRDRLAADAAPLKVGLYWATTEVQSKLAALKSTTLDQLAPLAGVPGVRFYSLQRGPSAAQAARPPPGMDLVDLSPELTDFADDAALMVNLDLVISIDTATAHLAGALARPVWTLTHFPPEWRWLQNRDDSPWYPTMRLFRQGKAESWERVAARVADALRERVTAKKNAAGA